MKKYQEIYKKAHYLVLLPAQTGKDTEVSFRIDEPNQQIDKLIQLHGKQTACFITHAIQRGGLSIT